MVRLSIPDIPNDQCVLTHNLSDCHRLRLYTVRYQFDNQEISIPIIHQYNTLRVYNKKVPESHY